MTNVWIDVRKLSRIVPFVLLLAPSALAGCHDSHEGGVGSESHFLVPCTRDEQCGELSCVAGGCTKPCTDDGECSALAEQSECLAKNPDAPRTTASAQICGVTCTRDESCEELGAGFRCASGRCSAQAANDGAGSAGRGEVDAGTSGPTAGATAGDPSTTDPRAPGALLPPGGQQPLDPGTISAGDLCMLSTAFPGDEACLQPPPAGEGVQIHIGPSHYDDAAELRGWTMEPGNEEARCWSFELPNTVELAFAEWELSTRPGIHSSVHVLDKSDGGHEICLEPGNPMWTTIPDLLVGNRTRIARTAAAPENAAIGRRLPAHSPASSWAHAFNFTDVPILIELWLNVYTPRATPAQYDVPLRAGPGSTLMLEPTTGDLATFSCPISGSGRLLALGALILPSTRQLEVTLQRASGESISLLRRIGALDSEPQLVPALRYDSVTTNPAIEMIAPASGFSGPVELAPGDVLNWSCILNSDSPAPNLCDLAGSATVAIDCE
ncbi:MAG TPA: hypothetical protein VK509_00345 [Polyangiales bacterium]|nr:hypothetical protein [Polyangiales bacterium]